MQLLLNVRIQDDMTFENYAAGENKIALEWLRRVAAGTEHYAYIWGEQGVGRSHLLQAVCHMATLQGRTTFYLPLAQHAIWSPSLLENLESIQIVCIDDIAWIAGNPLWEEALLRLYNRLKDNMHGLVISGDVLPSGLSLQLADLRSRFMWGNVLRIAPLADSEKIRILCMRAEKRGFSLPWNVAQFLFKRVSRNMGELFSVLDKLDEASLSAKRRLTIPFVKKVLCV